MRVGVGVTLDFLTIRIVACLPFGTLLGIVQNNGSLADTVAKALATCRLSSRSFALIRMDHLISMRATVARAVIHALAFNESSTYGVNGMDEIDTSHISSALAREKEMRFAFSSPPCLLSNRQ